MTALELVWDEPALRARLEAAWPGIALEIVPATGSTNTDLLERARLASLAPSVRVAERQERGRGRQGRTWRSATGASLTFSVAVPLAAADWSGLSLAAGVAVAEALDAAGPPRIGVKWPNDLWLLDAPLGAPSARIGRKVGGILIESVTTDRPRMAVIGIGLNVRPFTVESDAALAETIASLSELDPTASAPAVLACAAPAVLEAMRTFEAAGFAAFAARYAERDLLAGRSVRTTHAEAREGRAEGVSPHGALRVRTAAGTRVEVASGEVSVRPADAAAQRG